MKIGIIGSMQFTEKMLEVKDYLNSQGHQAFLTDLHQPFIGKTDEEKEQIKLYQKNNLDAIREFWRKMQGAEAVLVLNYDKNGFSNYIGGNTFLEMGFAHVLGQKIFLLNPLPEIPLYKTEIEAMKPVILNGDLNLLHPKKMTTGTVKKGRYQHYKGNYYQVLHTGWHSDSMEDYVVYQGLYNSEELGHNPVFVKSVEEFNKKVLINGEEVPRFRFLSEDDLLKCATPELDWFRMDQFFIFLKEIEKLKYIERAIRVSGWERFENTAEHTWHMAMIILVLKELYPFANMEKMLKMALVHDLVEIYAGDTPLYDAEARKNKAEREKFSAEKLFSLLPEELETEFHELFTEFEIQLTLESKIVRSCDELQAVIQNILSQGKTWQDKKLDYNWLISLSRKKMGTPYFQCLWDHLFKEVKEKKLAWNNQLA